MIRIDELYNNTLWPWLQQNRPGVRLFFCDPPGSTNPDDLCNHGSDSIREKDFLFLHDQEPIHLDIHKSLFDKVVYANQDLVTGTMQHPQLATKSPNPVGSVITSELGENLEALCNMYQWKSHYYFYHGWACLDWFRGYDKTFLIARARDREPSRTFMSPNRIIGGKRDHRVLFLYKIFKNQLEHNHISAPKICPVEAVDIVDVAKRYSAHYPDIMEVLLSADLPRTFKGEDTQQMTSCWLTNFAEAADSMVYVPTETVYFGRRLHITEKTFKAIALEMPFVLLAPAGSLAYMRRYGFKTFDSVWDESYDKERNDFERLNKVSDLLCYLDSLDHAQRQGIWQKCLPIVEHNFNHFYGGDFAKILWEELQHMMTSF
jgi:hypothetical protein